MPKNDMENDSNHEQGEKPLEPAVERVRRKLMWFMIVSTTITFLLVFAVVAAVIYKVMKPEAEKTIAATMPNPALVENTIAVPQGARLISQSLSGDRISLQVADDTGKTMLIIYDLRAAKEIARLTIIAAE